MKKIPPQLAENAARMKQGKPLKRANGSTTPAAPQFKAAKPAKKK